MSANPTAIKSLSHTHQAIMDYMMAFPAKPLGEIAQHFGYTQPWLSQIIHSDAFQNMLKEKQGMAFHHTVLGMREKMNEAANLAMDKILHLLPNETEIRSVKDVAEMMLDRIGYGTGKGNGVTINQQNNFVTPNSTTAEIAAARAAMLARAPQALGVIVDGVSLPITLPRESITSVGEVIGPSDFSSAEGYDPAREARS